MRRLLPLLLLIALPLAASDASSTYFANVTLVDQDGKTQDLYALMKDRTIVMNTFFTSCEVSCPIMARTFASLQDRFADRIGKDLVLVSITVDPATDTPERMKAYATKMKAKSGWYFLTGTKEQVDLALKKIGLSVDVRDNHLNVMLAGNDKTGLWKKLNGMASSEELAKLVASVVDDR